MNPSGRHFQIYEGYEVPGNSQHGLTKGILCLATTLQEWAAQTGAGISILEDI